ncbi:MAG TPA: biliverdin-producing heme oxygenase [Phycisphaerae bacterium]|nr:biliverdin-producing heme oxygenase [Phycisphaerae bacterium]
MIVTERSISRRLKQETRIQHERAERHRLPQALRDGRLPRRLYADWLAQRFLIHRALAREAATLADRNPVVRRIVEHQHDVLAKLRADLTFFNVDPDTVRPASAGTKLIASIEHTARFSPVALLGVCYVLHVTGDRPCSGVQQLRRAYGLEPGPGTLYLDSGCRYYRAGGCALKLAEDADLVSRLETHTLVAAARTTYILSAELEDEVLPHVVPKRSGGAATHSEGATPSMAGQAT